MKPLVKIAILLLFFAVFQVEAQSSDSKWAFGAGIGLAKFSSSDSEFIGDQFNFQIPRISASRYFFYGLTLDAAASFNTINKLPGIENTVNYLSLDGAIKYDFGRSQDDLVPYLSLGGSIVKTQYKMTPTLNFGGGGTFWFNSTYGVNSQLIYKYSQSSFESMRSHVYFSIGVVYSLNPRIGTPRLWNQKH